MSQLVESLREAVRQELRTTLCLERPEPVRMMPYDIDAEQELCAAAVDGRITPSEMQLKASDFYANIHAYVWVACDAVISAGLRPTEESILAALYADGIWNAYVPEDVHRIAHLTPCISKTRLEARAREVAAHAEARRLIEQLEQLAAELRSGSLSAAEARSRL